MSPEDGYHDVESQEMISLRTGYHDVESQEMISLRPR